MNILRIMIVFCIFVGGVIVGFGLDSVGALKSAQAAIQASASPFGAINLGQQPHGPAYIVGSAKNLGQQPHGPGYLAGPAQNPAQQPRHAKYWYEVAH